MKTNYTKLWMAMVLFLAILAGMLAGHFVEAAPSSTRTIGLSGGSVSGVGTWTFTQAAPTASFSSTGQPAIRLTNTNTGANAQALFQATNDASRSAFLGVTTAANLGTGLVQASTAMLYGGLGLSLGLGSHDAMRFYTGGITSSELNGSISTAGLWTIGESGGTQTHVVNGNVSISGTTATTVPYLDASKVLTSSAVTPTELGYLSGVSSGIQTQINAKAPSANPTFTGVILSDDGSNGAPAYSFSGDTNTGMYRVGTDRLGLATAGSLRGGFDEDGDFHIGSTLTTYTASRFSLSGTTTDAGAGQQSVRLNQAFAHTSGANSNSHYGLYADPDLAATNTQNWTSTYSLTGAYVAPIIRSASSGTPAITSVNAIRAQIQNLNTANTTVTSARNIVVQDGTSTGTITNHYGITVEDMTKGGTINANLVLGGTAAASGNWNIYGSSTRDNLLAGDLAVQGDVTIGGGAAAANTQIAVIAASSSSDTGNITAGNSSTITLASASTAGKLLVTDIANGDVAEFLISHNGASYITYETQDPGSAFSATDGDPSVISISKSGTSLKVNNQTAGTVRVRLLYLKML